MVFRGPHSYVSPTWYEPDAPAVPTWNYAVVEAYGTPRIVDDAEELRAQQKRLVATHEAGRSPSWTMDGQPPAYIEGMLKGIVGFEIPIARLEGKFKLSQNRSTADQRQGRRSSKRQRRRRRPGARDADVGKLESLKNHTRL